MSLSKRSIGLLKKIIEPKLEAEGKLLTKLSTELRTLHERRVALTETLRNASSNELGAGLNSALMAAKSDAGNQAWRLVNELDQKCAEVAERKQIQHKVVAKLLAKKKVFEQLEQRINDRKIVDLYNN